MNGFAVMWWIVTVMGITASIILPASFWMMPEGTFYMNILCTIAGALMAILFFGLYLVKMEELKEESR